MKKNIHPVERMVRILGGAALMPLAFWGPHDIWFLLGVIPYATGLLGWCPLYALLGVNMAGCCNASGCETTNKHEG